jgi:dTDP-4-amino-4,6-dideoxygalactose transaminase
MTNIPFAKPFIGREEEEAVLCVLRSGWLTTAEEALSFEREFALFLANERKEDLTADSADGKNLTANKANDICALAVNSATSGLHLALEALGVGAGDLVLLPSYTFTSDAEVVRYLGAEAVFVDVAKDSFLIDPQKLEETLARLKSGGSAYKNGGVKGRPACIMPTHFAGLCCDMTAILAISKKYDIPVVEDCAHAFPAFDKGGGGVCGCMGDIGVFSFYATKTITTGEGGMVVTRRSDIAQRMRTMRLHGIDRPVWNRYTNAGISGGTTGTSNAPAWYYEVIDSGFKYNMPDILASIGRVQLRRAKELLAIRREIAASYDEAFSRDERFIIPPSNDGDARHLYPLRLSQKCPVSRDEAAAKMKDAGIGVSVHFIPLHTMPFYKKRYNHVDGDFPETMKSFSGELSLPLWPGLAKDQIDRIIKTVADVCR